MATFDNDLRLKEITTGDEDGQWGTSTNTNLSLIADAFSLGTKQLAADASESFTMPNAAADGARSLYLKITSAVSLTATRTVTLLPNTVSKVWIIENATTGSQIITIAQGSGATINVPNGNKVMVVTDGAGAGAAVFIANPTTLTNANLTGAVTSTGNATLLGSFTSANLAAAVTDETGTGALVFGTSPTLVTPALGTPASGVVTNLTGTASININGTVGAATPAAGAFTTLNTSGAVVFNEAGANVDFRVESDTVDHALFVEGSSGNVGFGTSSPAYKLDVIGGIRGRPVPKVFNITKGNVGSGTVETFTLSADSNVINLTQSYGSRTGSRTYFADFTAGLPTEIGSILHLEIESSATNTDTVARARSTAIRFGGVDILTTGNIALQPSASYSRKLRRTLILTEDGWQDIGLNNVQSSTRVNETIFTSGDNYTERLRITSAGKVGIGTSSPYFQLGVAGDCSLQGGPGKRLSSTNGVTVATSPVTIGTNPDSMGQLNVVNGISGSDRFCDLVMSSNGQTPVVVQSFTALGSPVARTYTQSSTNFQLSMASGSYVVANLALGTG